MVNFWAFFGFDNTLDTFLLSFDSVTERFILYNIYFRV